MRNSATPQYDVGVIVGRFQTDTLHKGHRDLIDHVCTAHEKVIIFLGVSPLWATVNNPLDFQSRAQMLQDLYPDIIVNYIDDMGDDRKWSAKLDKQIGNLVSPAQTVLLYGSRDSFIEHYTGRHPTQQLESDQVFSGTAERKRIATGNTRGTEDFRAGVIWATQARFPTAFQTVDIAILDETGQKVLLGRKPNFTKYQFVGGFSDPSSPSLEADARREAQEETGLSITDPVYIGSAKIEDWRYRSERDCIKTAMFVAKVLSGKAEAADDIEEVRWFELPRGGFGPGTFSTDGKSIDFDRFASQHVPLMGLLMNHINKTSKGAR